MNKKYVSIGLTMLLASLSAFSMQKLSTEEIKNAKIMKNVVKPTSLIIDYLSMEQLQATGFNEDGTLFQCAGYDAHKPGVIKKIVYDMSGAEQSGSLDVVDAGDFSRYIPEHQQIWVGSDFATSKDGSTQILKFSFSKGFYYLFELEKQSLYVPKNGQIKESVLSRDGLSKKMTLLYEKLYPQGCKNTWFFVNDKNPYNSRAYRSLSFLRDNLFVSVEAPCIPLTFKNEGFIESVRQQGLYIRFYDRVNKDTIQLLHDFGIFKAPLRIFLNVQRNFFVVLCGLVQRVGATQFVITDVELHFFKISPIKDTRKTLRNRLFDVSMKFE